MNTIAEIEQALNEKKKRLEQLTKKKEEMLGSIQDIDAEIAMIQGDRKVRVRNDITLKEIIDSVLTKNKKGLTLSEITEAVPTFGYVSNSKNLSSVVYQAVYHNENIKRNESGKYQLV